MLMQSFAQFSAKSRILIEVFTKFSNKQWTLSGLIKHCCDFTYQQNNAPDLIRAWDNAAIKLQRPQTSSRQLCGQPTRLSIKFGGTEATGACLPQRDSRCRPAEVAPDRRVRTFPAGDHRWSGQAVSSPRLKLCPGHTENIVNTDFRCVWH